MIILDTNVISELFRAVPDDRVMRWIAAREADALFTTAVSEAEIFRGIELMPTGRRRLDLFAATMGYFRSDLAGRVLSFDSAAARKYAEISASRKRGGLPEKGFEAQIAAIAAIHGASLATRNIRDFTGCGVELVNPWGEASVEH